MKMEVFRQGHGDTCGVLRDRSATRAVTHSIRVLMLYENVTFRLKCQPHRWIMFRRRIWKGLPNTTIAFRVDGMLDDFLVGEYCVCLCCMKLAIS